MGPIRNHRRHHLRRRNPRRSHRAADAGRRRYHKNHPRRVIRRGKVHVGEAEEVHLTHLPVKHHEAVVKHRRHHRHVDRGKAHAERQSPRPKHPPRDIGRIPGSLQSHRLRRRRWKRMGRCARSKRVQLGRRLRRGITRNGRNVDHRRNPVGVAVNYVGRVVVKLVRLTLTRPRDNVVAMVR